MFRRLKETLAAALFGAALLAAPAAQAECYGRNLLDQMAPDSRAALQAAAQAVPYPVGNFWRAERDGARLTILGTYHLDDPRHDPVLQHFAPEIAAAATVLVEAGPAEEQALLDRMAADPSILLITEGPNLMQLLPPDIWAGLKQAAADRGIPAFMAAKFRPWYITVLLAVPPCALEEMTDPKGLDGRVIDTALAAGVPVRALEPFDTVFSVFGAMTPQEQIDMIAQTLALEDRIADFSLTLADAYFDGENRLMWELMRQESYDMPGYTREQVDAEMARMEDLLMVRRNRAWIPVIEDAARQGPAVVAFGALHLSGQDGVLNLLARNGWTITPIALP